MSRVVEIDVELLDPIDVAVKGKQEKDISLITIKAPSRRNAKNASKLKQLANRSIVEFTKDLSSEDKKQAVESEEAKERSDSKAKIDPEKSAVEIMNLLSGTSVDFEQLYSCLDQLLINGCGSVAGIPLTKGIVDLFSYEDTERICGYYLNAFLLRSL